MESNEIITVQFGPLANRCLTHFWKYQEFYLQQPDSSESPFLLDVLYELRSSKCQYRPRLLAIDSIDVINFGLDLDAELPSFVRSQYPWDGKVDRIVRSSHSDYQAENWLHCLPYRTRRSWHDNDLILKLSASLGDTTFLSGDNVDSSSPLSTFGQGLEFGDQILEECEDRLRKLAECCSRPDGFHFVLDSDNGFSGIASRIMECVVTEFPKRQLLTVPIRNSNVVQMLNKRQQQIVEANRLSLLNQLETTDDFGSHCKWLPFDVASAFQRGDTSDCGAMSLLAGALSTFVTPVNLKRSFGGISFHKLCSDSEFISRNMLTLRTTTMDCDTMDVDEPGKWYELNPYLNLIKPIQISLEQHSPVIFRKLMLRGVTNQKWIDNLYQYANRKCDSKEPIWFIPYVQYLCNTISPSICSLPDHPLQILSDKSLNPVKKCTQASRSSQVIMVDTPNNNSLESLGLRRLVQNCMLCKNYPPDGKMELGLWRELLESSQIRLVEAYRM